MIFNVNIRKANTEQGSRYHRADKSGAVSANNHSDSDRHSRDTEAFANTNHYRQHTIEVAVCIEGKCERHGKDTDNQGNLLTEEVRETHNDNVAHAGNNARNGSIANFYSLNQDTHKYSSTHQGGAHHKSRASVRVDDFLLQLCTGIVYQDSNGHTNHERKITWEHIPY